MAHPFDWSLVSSSDSASALPCSSRLGRFALPRACSLFVTSARFVLISGSVEQGKSDLGPSWLHDDVAAAAGDCRASAFFHHSDQGHVTDEVDIREEFDFPLRKVSSYGKKPATKGIRAGAADGFSESVPIA